MAKHKNKEHRDRTHTICVAWVRLPRASLLRIQQPHKEC